MSSADRQIAPQYIAAAGKAGLAYMAPVAAFFYVHVAADNNYVLQSCVEPEFQGVSSEAIHALLTRQRRTSPCQALRACARDPKPLSSVLLLIHAVGMQSDLIALDPGVSSFKSASSSGISAHCPTTARLH